MRGVDINVGVGARTGETRPLNEAEAVALRHAAEFTERPTRHAAAAALALAGGFSGEIGHVGPHDLDLDGHRVWLHGSTKTASRWCPLNEWGERVLAARATLVRSTAPAGGDACVLRLAVSARNGSDEQLQARVCVALRDLLKAIGLGADPAIRPTSITAFAGWQAFADTGRVEAAARRLGMTSLDSTAALIGYGWRTGNDADAQEEAEAAGHAR
ncbi:hypothetical protein AB0H77_08485 [Streptomyces sp. NPDC050844]|uniref:hypothetical protein n=1 Tax=Streptomyces sp. NPDC050844 TaxID=3155790 RepID=UPI0033EB0B0B